MNINEIRAAISARRAELNDSFINNKIYENMSVEEYFKQDNVLSGLKEIFIKVRNRTPKNER